VRVHGRVGKDGKTSSLKVLDAVRRTWRRRRCAWCPDGPFIRRCANTSRHPGDGFRGQIQGLVSRRRQPAAAGARQATRTDRLSCRGDPSDNKDMEQRFLGSSGLSVSSLSLGTMTFGGKGRHAAMGALDAERAGHLVDIAIEQGVTLFDTADIYSEGLAEEVLGATLKAGGRVCRSPPRPSRRWGRDRTTLGCRATT